MLSRSMSLYCPASKSYNQIQKQQRPPGKSPWRPHEKEMTTNVSYQRRRLSMSSVIEIGPIPWRF